MKVRKLLMMTIILTLVFGTAAFAESVNKNLRVVINKKEIEDAGIFVDGKAYIAVRNFANAMQAMLLWDEDAKKVTVYKPNVHMLTMKDKTTFQSVPRGKNTKFFVYAQVDSLKTDISNFKITITDPYGEDTLIEARDSSDDNFPSGMEDFGITSKEISYNFDNVGRYIVRFWMKPAKESSMQVVAEKVISVKSLA